MSSTITNIEQITLTVTEVDGLGAAVAFGSVPGWTNSADAVATVLAAPDGITALVTAVSIGTTTVAVSVDGLSTTWDVTVTASAGVQLIITASAPTPIVPVAA